MAVKVKGERLMAGWMTTWLAVLVTLASTAGVVAADEIRIAIGTQDTTINCATAGPLIRELKLLDKYLPRMGKYANAKYDLVWKTFTSGPPVTNEMVANKLDIGMMGDFPSILNGVTFDRSPAGVKSLYVATISASVTGGGNGVVVPLDSPAHSLKDLKGKQISVPFGSAAHGMLLRAIKDLGWDPDKDVNLVSQSPEIGGSALKGKKIDAHADFVPFAELFPFRGFAKKIYEGATVGVPTSHGVLVRSDYAEKYPEIVVAFLKAMLEANRLYAEKPEELSEKMQQWTGIEAEVNYMFHGPLGIQTVDFTIKPEYVKGLRAALDTLKLIKRAEGEFNVDKWVTDKFIRQAAVEMKVDYDKRLRSYAPLPLTGTDAFTGKPIDDPKQAGQIWVKGEGRVRGYATPEATLGALRKLEAEKKDVRVAFVHDRGTGFKVFAEKAWYVTGAKGGDAAFLLRGPAEEWAKTYGGSVVDFAAAKQAVK
jgi:sulfonate transport system substrate-binding protein